jgi:hypothetical protein
MLNLRPIALIIIPQVLKSLSKFIKVLWALEIFYSLLIILQLIQTVLIIQTTHATNADMDLLLSTLAVPLA